MTNPTKSVYTPYLVRFLPVKETKPTTTHTCSHTNNSHRHADTVEGIVLEYRQGLGTAGRLHFHSSLSCTGEGNGDPPVFLPGEPQGRGSPVGCRLWVAQSRTRLKWLSSSSRPRVVELIVMFCPLPEAFLHSPQWKNTAFVTRNYISKYSEQTLKQM